jgi:hypothetical protein
MGASYSLNHSGWGGVPMPSTISDISEFDALVDGNVRRKLEDFLRWKAKKRIGRLFGPVSRRFPPAPVPCLAQTDQARRVSELIWIKQLVDLRLDLLDRQSVEFRVDTDWRRYRSSPEVLVNCIGIVQAALQLLAALPQFRSLPNGLFELSLFFHIWMEDKESLRNPWKVFNTSSM